MGSKGLKAIVIEKEGSGRPESSDRHAFSKAARRFAQLLAENEGASTNLPTWGTNRIAKVINDAGLYPTRNFREGQFELIDNISGETQREIILFLCRRPTIILFDPTGHLVYAGETTAKEKHLSISVN